MPISDVLLAFTNCNNDPIAICDIFEETPIEKRLELDALVLQQFGCGISQLYYRETKCVASLYFDFENSLPKKFEDTELEYEHGQILDYQIRTASITSFNDEPELILNRIINHNTTPHIVTQNQECIHGVDNATERQDTINATERQEIMQQDEELSEMGQLCLEPDITCRTEEQAVHGIMGQIDVSLSHDDRSSHSGVDPTTSRELEVIHPTSPTYSPYDYPPTRRRANKSPSPLLQNMNVQNVANTPYPSFIRKERRSRFSNPQVEENVNGEFQLRYIQSKRRKTDDIIIFEMKHQGMTAYITTNMSSAIELSRQHSNSDPIRFGTYNFICIEMTADKAKRFACWLYSQIKDGHLSLF